MKVLQGTSQVILARTAAVLIAALLCAAAKTQPVDQKVLEDSATALGRIGVAKLALAYGLKGEAQANIKSALDAADALQSQASTFSLKDPLVFGRLSYKTAGGPGESLIPLVGGVFPSRMLGEKLLKSGAMAAELTDAGVVRARVSVNGKDMKTGLLKAEAAIKSGRTDEALAALNVITDGAVTPGAVESGTLAVARDNLSLAQQLLRDKDFKAAAFAAGHAKDALAAAAESDAALKAKAADTDKAIKGLGDLGDSIRAGRLATLKAPETAALDVEKELDGLTPRN